MESLGPSESTSLPVLAVVLGALVDEEGAILEGAGGDLLRRSSSGGRRKRGGDFQPPTH